MSFNGSGTYSLPAGNPITTGTTISSTWANTTLSDIATGLTTAICKDGQSTPTANLPMGGYRHTGAGAAVNTTDYARADQTQNSAFQWLTTVAGTDTITASATPTPAAYAAGQTFRFVSAGANTTTSVTLKVNGLGAKNITKNGSTALAVGDIPSGALVEVTYDGTQFQAAVLKRGTAAGLDVGTSANNVVQLDGSAKLPAVDGSQLTGIVVTSFSPPIRQTVLSGPVDSNGLAAFGGSTGSTTVTASGTLTITAANGATTTGNVDKTFQITNPSWTGLSTNGTMYLYVDWNSGTPTTGSTTLAPTYQWGGTYSTTSGQHTFNIQEMVMKVGNGASAAQTYRVFVGEVTVAGGVVTAITWYALMGQYSSGWFTVAANTVYSKNHNLGSPFWTFQVFATTDSGATVMPVQGTYFDGSNNWGWISVSGTTNTSPRNAVSIKTSVAGGVPSATPAGYLWFVNRSW